MKIASGTVVTLTYILRENNSSGPISEVMDNFYPFEFLFGYGLLLPAFEKNLEGLTEEDTFSFTLLPEEAYGLPDDEQIVEVPIHVFEMDGQVPDGLLVPENTVTLTDDTGKPHTGKIKYIGNDNVTVDFNHIMAGKTLHFSGQILKVRAATHDEKARRHHIPEDGIQRS